MPQFQATYYLAARIPCAVDHFFICALQKDFILLFGSPFKKEYLKLLLLKSIFSGVNI